VTKGKGYLLPSGDASEEELACCIVFYPARDEYRRALMGSLDYLATWIAWERDSEKRGQDAAASWKLANIQTWECCSMGFCNDLLTGLDEILAAIIALECCADQDITDGDQYTDPIVDGEGDVPQNIIDAGYAEDAEDWAGFDSYKCMISHLAVDHVESFFREIAPHLSETGTIFGGMGVLGTLMGGILILLGLPLAGGLVIALGAAAAIWNWITKYGKGAVEDIADEIATHHDALACAIYEGDGVADSVSDFNDKVDELFSSIDAAGIKAINIAPQLKAMYSGRYDQQDIAQKLADQGYETVGYVCDCEEQEPPPSGYHLVNAGQMEWLDNYGCNDTGSFLNPDTGIVTLDFNVVSESNWWNKNKITTAIPESDGWLRHGWVLDLISYSGPTVGPKFRSDPHFPTPITIGVDINVGDSWAGFNSYAHSGQDWDDWAAQYDFVYGINSNPALNLWDLVFGKGDTVITGQHLCVFRLRIMVED
jgi:hypothetical protein